MSAHNVYFQLLLSFGLFGFLPWIMGVVGTFAVVWHHRKTSWGSILLTLFLATLVAGAAANLGHSKIFWVVLAFAGRAEILAGEPVVSRRRARRIRHTTQAMFSAPVRTVDALTEPLQRLSPTNGVNSNRQIQSFRLFTE